MGAFHPPRHASVPFHAILYFRWGIVQESNPMWVSILRGSGEAIRSSWTSLARKPLARFLSLSLYLSL